MATKAQKISKSDSAKAEKNTDSKEEKSKARNSFLKPNIWMVLTIIFIFLLAIVVIQKTSCSSVSDCPANTETNQNTGNQANVKSPDAVKSDVEDYLEVNFLEVQGLSLADVQIEEYDDFLYSVSFSITDGNNTQLGRVQVTKDGKTLILGGQLLDMSVPLAAPTQQEPTPAQEIPKSDVPDVKLFVMSYCPYGTQAEKAMAPVAELIGDAVTIEPTFIVNIDGDIINSLHGQTEVDENIIQACIREDFPDKLWAYLDCFADSKDFDSCLTSAEIDKTAVETCATARGFDLMVADAGVTSSNGVSSSPTLIINGVKYQGQRTAEAYKTAICSAFLNPPEDCSQILSGATASASGSC